MLEEQTSQTNPETSPNQINSLSLKLFDAGEGTFPLPVAVKNITTVGVILEILNQDNGLPVEGLKGHEGLLTLINQQGHGKIEIPGKVLWTSNRQADAGITLGLELLGPLPLEVRHALEADMAIGAKDMKFLWDYWDEIQASATPVDITEPTAPTIFVQDKPAAAALEPDVDCEPYQAPNSNQLYWIGFGAIMTGLALQVPQSEYLGFGGLIVMFLGSLAVAWKSVISLFQSSS